MKPIVFSKVTPTVRLRSQFALLLLTAAAGLACILPRAASEPAEPAILLHIDFRSGGDAPIGFLMTFREDRSVRLLSPRGAVRMNKISSTDAAELQALLQSREVVAWLGSVKATGDEFACCDAKEVGIYLGDAAEPIGVRLDEPGGPAAGEIRLFEYLNRVGRHYFGSRYTISLPLR